MPQLTVRHLERERVFRLLFSLMKFCILHKLSVIFLCVKHSLRPECVIDTFVHGTKRGSFTIRAQK